MEKKSVFVNGGNGGRVGRLSHADELENAQDVARRYRCEFVDLHNFQLHHDLFKNIPVHLMFRYNFIPLEETADGRLAIAIADPSQLMMIDEISMLLRKRIITKVSTLAQISEILKKTEQSKRVLEDASEGFTLDVIPKTKRGDESISIDRLAAKGDIARSSGWWIPRSSPRFSAGPAIFISKLRTTRFASSSALTACLHKPCRRSRRSIIRRSFRASRS